MSGIIATGVVAHVPTLSRAEITPDFQDTLVEGERPFSLELIDYLSWAWFWRCVLEPRSLADQVDRIQFFSSESAGALAAESRDVQWRDLVLRPPARFVRAYVLKSGWRDGVPGLIIAANTAFHVFLKYAKLWERRQLGGAGSGDSNRSDDSAPPR